MVLQCVYYNFSTATITIHKYANWIKKKNFVKNIEKYRVINCK